MQFQFNFDLFCSPSANQKIWYEHRPYIWRIVTLTVKRCLHFQVSIVRVWGMCVSFSPCHSSPPTHYHSRLWSVSSLLHCSSCIVDAFSNKSGATQAPAVCSCRLPTLPCCLAWQLNVFCRRTTCLREHTFTEPTFSRMGYCPQQWRSSFIFLQHFAVLTNFFHVPFLLAYAVHSAGACLKKADSLIG